MELQRLKINDNIYTLDPMNPLEGMEFGEKVLGAISPTFAAMYEAFKEEGDQGAMFNHLALALRAGGLTPILKEALNQCFTPENESLRDEAVFNKWFRRHPGDMYQLGVKATWELVKPFISPQLGTMLAGFQTRLNQLNPNTELRCLFQKDGESKQ